jgi:hypothetical protein
VRELLTALLALAAARQLAPGFILRGEEVLG